MRPPSRDAGCARVLASTHDPRVKRAQGTPGAPLAPIASRGNEENHTSFSHHRPSRFRDIPCAMVLTVSSELSPEARLCCLRRERIAPLT
jgi:hypothetical protein